MWWCIDPQKCWRKLASKSLPKSRRRRIGGCPCNFEIWNGFSVTANWADDGVQWLFSVMQFWRIWQKYFVLCIVKLYNVRRNLFAISILKRENYNCKRWGRNIKKCKRSENSDTLTYFRAKRVNWQLRLLHFIARRPFLQRFSSHCNWCHLHKCTKKQPL